MYSFNYTINGSHFLSLLEIAQNIPSRGVCKPTWSVRKGFWILRKNSPLVFLRSTSSSPHGYKIAIRRWFLQLMNCTLVRFSLYYILLVIKANSHIKNSVAEDFKHHETDADNTKQQFGVTKGMFELISPLVYYFLD